MYKTENCGLTIKKKESELLFSNPSWKRINQIVIITITMTIIINPKTKKKKECA